MADQNKIKNLITNYRVEDLTGRLAGKSEWLRKFALDGTGTTSAIKATLAYMAEILENLAPIVTDETLEQIRGKANAKNPGHFETADRIADADNNIGTAVERCAKLAQRLRRLAKMVDLYCNYMLQNEEERAMECLIAFYDATEYPEDERTSLSDPGWDATAVGQMAAEIGLVAAGLAASR